MKRVVSIDSRATRLAAIAAHAQDCEDVKIEHSEREVIRLERDDPQLPSIEGYADNGRSARRSRRAAWKGMRPRKLFRV